MQMLTRNELIDALRKQLYYQSIRHLTDGDPYITCCRKTLEDHYKKMDDAFEAMMFYGNPTFHGRCSHDDTK